MGKTFTAEAFGPPRRRFLIYHCPIVGQPDNGWKFVCENYDADAGWRLGNDFFEIYFWEILRYPRTTQAAR
jgi:hypothetical protein